MLRSFLLAVTTYSLVACIAVSTGETLFVVLPERQDSLITATKVDHGVVLDVYSESGIGGDYPDHIRLRLHLHGLEELRLAYGATVLILSIASNHASVVLAMR